MATQQLQQATHLSGGTGQSATSAQAGYLPISLARAPLAAFQDIPIYVRARDKSSSDTASFVLYCAEHTRFSDAHRERLVDDGVKIV